MAIQWQESDQKSQKKPPHESASAPAPHHAQAAGGNPWFAVSVGLLGIIVGFGTGSWHASVLTPPQLAAQPQAVGQPVPPPAPVAPPAPAEPETAADLIAFDPDTDHYRGSADAEVILYEYSDFECPFCGRVHPTLEQVVKDYDGKVAWVYRHYPLPFHSNAQKAAEAAECAAELGGNDKFWALADLLFEKGADNTKLVDYAKEIGLNETAFKTCLDSGKHAARVASDMEGGSKAGVSGTPGNIVALADDVTKNRIVSGAQPLPAFKTAIDALLAE